MSLTRGEAYGVLELPVGKRAFLNITVGRTDSTFCPISRTAMVVQQFTNSNCSLLTTELSHFAAQNAYVTF